MLTIHPPVLAHRGARREAPENTISAFMRAKQRGANWVEFDVRLCADELIVIHDETLDRTTNGKGHVNNIPYAALQNLDAGSWFSSDFTGERIPTLREVIAFLGRVGMNANIEIKDKEGREEELVNAVLKSVSEHWQHPMNPPLISSFSVNILKLVRKYSATAILGFLMNEWQDNWEKICNELNCAAVDVNHQILNSNNVKIIKKSGRLLLAYTVNNLIRANELFSWGVDAVFTDDVKVIVTNANSG